MAEVQVEAVRKAVLEHCPAGMDVEVKDYLAATVVALFEDDAEADAEALRPELQGVAGPLLEDYDVTDKDAEDFCERILKAGFNGVAIKGANAKLSADTGGGAPAECLCHIPNLLLMYGGSPQPLLKNATLELLHGGRYGIVGANGTGKTTLMARLATKDIVGFPQNVRVVHLRHEAILRGVHPSTSALDYARRHEGGVEELSAALRASLLEVGFDGDDMLGKAVGALSGGWQMRLALACALAKRANLLLLDEPTNHLDTVAVDWLVEFVNRTCSAHGNEDCTALIVSHDADFLNRVCTHIVHFTPEASLAYHEGSFDAFKATVLSGDEAKAQQLLEVGSKAGAADENLPWGGALAASLGSVDKLVFPNPEKIPGQPSEVLALRNVTFQHEGAESPVLNNLDLHLAYNSRVAIVGRNGSGKSTLLSLLAGRLEPCKGEIWSHPHLRLVYIAQHHESQLKSFLANTPMEYMQLRFKRGYDLEAMTPRLETTHITEKQARRNRELAKKLGKRGAEPEAIVSRQFVGKDGRDAVYEVKWQGLTPADNSFEKRSRLKSLGVEYMANEYDEMMAIAWGSSPERPLTDKELHSHLEDFGLPQEVTTKRQISMLSSGQRSKLMLAASFWTRPHIVCLDEPTNYLDSDTVEQLQKALRNFRGGFVVVSHSETFVADVANEIWTAAAGSVTAAPVALG